MRIFARSRSIIMLLRVLLVEQVSESTLHCVWKFPDATEDEILLLERIEYLWRAGSPQTYHILRASNWQTVMFDKDVVIITEYSDEPGVLAYNLISKLRQEYSKSRCTKDLARCFIEAKTSDEDFSADSDASGDRSSSLISLLNTIPDRKKAAQLWACALQGCVLLCDGGSTELYKVGKILANNAKSQLYPLMLHQSGKELADILSYGSVICCCPSMENLGDSMLLPIGGHWDAVFKISSRQVLFRDNTHSNMDVSNIEQVLQTSTTDSEFKRLTLGDYEDLTGYNLI